MLAGKLSGNGGGVVAGGAGNGGVAGWSTIEPVSLLGALVVTPAGVVTLDGGGSGRRRHRRRWRPPVLLHEQRRPDDGRQAVAARRRRARPGRHGRPRRRGRHLQRQELRRHRRPPADRHRRASSMRRAARARSAAAGATTAAAASANFPDEIELIAVLINCDGKHGTTANWLVNRGWIIARGGAANGNGGDIVYHGRSPDGDTSPPSGNIDNAGTAAAVPATTGRNESKEHRHEPVISKRGRDVALGGGVDGRIGVLGRALRQRDLEERQRGRRRQRRRAGGGRRAEGGGGTAARRGGPAVPPEVDGQLVINELMAANALTIKDEAGAARPWIEILNPTDTDVPLRGYGVTDDLAAPVKGVIGDGVSCPRAATWCVWLDGNPEAGPTHVAAYLSKAGGSVGLARPGRIVHRPARLRRAGDRPVGRARAGRRARPGRSSGTSRRARRIRRGAARRARPRPIRSRCPRPATRATGSSATTRCRSSRSRSAPPRFSRC